jgi:transcriptional regulator with XRE-family HTH domain
MVVSVPPTNLRVARYSARLAVEARGVLASRIRSLSEGRFSQRSLATATGLGIGTVRDVWAGRSDPTLSTMLALTETLGLRSVEELLGPLGTQALLALQRGTAAARTA